jgi:hypothetical protein
MIDLDFQFGAIYADGLYAFLVAFNARENSNRETESDKKNRRK